METKNKKQELPAWFNGQVYTHGETVTNPFSGEIYHLNNLELSMYDFIMGSLHVCLKWHLIVLRNNKSMTFKKG